MSYKQQNSGRALQIVLIALFLALSLLPSLGMIVFGASESSANEILASKPAIVTKDGRFNAKILSDVSDYIADRFAFRQNFVTAWSRLNAAAAPPRSRSSSAKTAGSTTRRPSTTIWAAP